jgi:hypothetical protein
MAIVPDTKDWTWALQRSCPECGFIHDPVRHPYDVTGQRR